MTLEQFKKRAKKIPDTPGVYFFLGPRKEVLYIGKATSLRDRVRSYFASDLPATRGPLIVSMLGKARSIDFRKTDSVLEALILEANLIRNYKPKHNTDLKDDKSWNYVVVTREDFPRVLLVRGKELHKGSSLRRNERETPARGTLAPQYKEVFGPFPHGGQLKQALKIIRKIFPYRDTCEAGVGRRCFNAQIGLCPGTCAGGVSKTEYRRTIRRITLLFQGKKKELLRSLERDMKRAAKEEKFEEAAKLRSQVFALNHIRDVSLIKDEYRDYRPTRSIVGERIEAYDIAHLGGSSAVGVMVVVEDGEAQKQDYRRFRIRSAKGGDDVGALREVLSRRLGHDEWPLPRVIAVDGAAAQMNAAEGVLKQYGVGIPVVGVVKNEKHRPRDIRGSRELIKGRERAILLANAEAHRFAISYHRKTSRKRLSL